MTASQFIDDVQKYQSDLEKEKIQRYFKTGEGEYGMGVHLSVSGWDNSLK